MSRILKRIIKKQFDGETLLETVLQQAATLELPTAELRDFFSRLPALLSNVEKAFSDIDLQMQMLYHNMEKSSAEQAAITKELKKSSAYIQRVMDSLGEGYISVDQSGKILSVYSARAVEFFGEGLTGQLWWERLGVRESDRNDIGDIFSRLIEDQIDFEVFTDLAPKSVDVGGRALSLAYKPLQNPDGSTEAMVIIVSDISESVKAQKAVKENKTRGDFLASVAVDPRPFQAFANYLITGAEKFIREPSSMKIGDYKTWLHNIKGTCELFALSTLNPLIHELEGVARALKTNESASHAMAMQTGASSVRDQFNDFIAKYEDSLPPDLLGRDRLVRVPLSRLISWGHLLKADSTVGGDQVIDSIMVPVESFFRHLDQALAMRAERQGKKVRVVRKLAALRIPPTADYETLFGSLNHIVNNMVDHGLEAPSARVERGKPAHGMITISATLMTAGSQSPAQMKITFCDDGQGLDLERIRFRAAEFGIAIRNDEDLKQVIFAKGFSTRKEANEFAGRGEGLGATADAVKVLGGAIQVESDPGRGVTFEILVPLPVSSSEILELMGREGSRLHDSEKNAA